jgi:hypothetical protein
MAGSEVKIICTFANNTSGQCWLVDADGTVIDYVTGDLSAVAGKASASNKFRVFAGRRSDPFFFNLSGFLTAKQTVNDATLGLNPQGCPTTVNAVSTDASGTSAALRSQLQAVPGGTVGPCAAGVADCFATFNVMAIVIQVDKDLVSTTANKFVSVWASTHAAP